MDVLGYYGGLLELLLAVNENSLEYVLLLLTFQLIYFFAYKNQIYSIFDPFVMAVFSAAVCFTDVVFMYFHDMIAYDENANLLQFIATEFAFYMGAKKVFKVCDNKNHVKINEQLKNILFYDISFLFCLLQIFSVFVVGLPVFSEGSRLAYYGGGTGAIPIISASIMTFLFMLISEKLFLGIRKCTCIEKIVILLDIVAILTALFGSGAKSGVLMIVFWLFYFSMYVKNVDSIKYEQCIKYIKKTQIIIFIFALGAAFTILWLNGNANVIGGMMIRVIGYGDIFAYWYNHDFTKYVVTENYIYDSISSLFAALRLISYDDVVVGVSQQIMLYYAPPDVTVAAYGPNFRHNLVGLLYFGTIGSLIYSFVAGLLFSYIRRNLYFRMNNNIVVYSIYVSVNFYAVSLMTEGFLGSSFLNLIYLLCILGFVIIFHFGLYKFLNVKVFIK